MLCIQWTHYQNGSRDCLSPDYCAPNFRKRVNFVRIYSYHNETNERNLVQIRNRRCSFLSNATAVIWYTARSQHSQLYWSIQMSSYKYSIAVFSFSHSYYYLSLTCSILWYSLILTRWSEMTTRASTRLFSQQPTTITWILNSLYLFLFLCVSVRLWAHLFSLVKTKCDWLTAVSIISNIFRWWEKSRGAFTPGPSAKVSKNRARERERKYCCLLSSNEASEYACDFVQNKCKQRPNISYSPKLIQNPLVENLLSKNRN